MAKNVEKAPIARANVQALNKLTVKDIMAGINWKKLAGAEGANGSDWTNAHEIDLFTIYGTARATFSGNTHFGEYVGFRGDFESVRCVDGKRSYSTAAILPPPTDQMVLSQFTHARILKNEEGEPRKDEDGLTMVDNNATLTCGFIIGAEPHDSHGEVKYRFTCKSIQVNAAPVDPLANVRAAMQEAMPSLFGGGAKQIEAPAQPTITK